MAKIPRQPKPCAAPAQPNAASLEPADVVLLQAALDAVDHVDAHLGLVEVVLGLSGRELSD